MPFSSGIPTFARIHVLIFRSVQLILSIRRHIYTHISKAVTSFSSHFFSAQLSDPYNAVLHISDRTRLFLQVHIDVFAFQITVTRPLVFEYCGVDPFAINVEPHQQERKRRKDLRRTFFVAATRAWSRLVRFFLNSRSSPVAETPRDCMSEVSFNSK